MVVRAVFNVRYCKEMGADCTVNHRNSFASEFGKLELGKVDIVYCTVDLNLHFDAIVPIVKPRGAIVFITSAAPVNVQALMYKRIRLCPELMFSRILQDDEPHKQGELLQRIADLVDAGKIRSNANVEVSWKEIPKGLALLQSGEAIGKMIYSVPELVHHKSEKGTIILQS